MVIIGLPIWFLTTSTYRASLPFDSIDVISSMKNLKIKVNFDLVFFNQNSVDRKKIEDQFLRELYTG